MSDILAFAGSTRSGSYNKLLVQFAAEKVRSHGGKVTLIDLRDYPLPLFDEDDEKNKPAPENLKKLKNLFLSHKGLLISSPEYNSSISGVLKNTIDWLSRPVPNEAPLAAFSGKVAALLSASPGQLGGLRGLVTVRSILGNIQVLVLPQQVAVPKAGGAFDDKGQLKDEKLAKSVDQLSKSLVETLQKLHI